MCCTLECKCRRHLLNRENHIDKIKPQNESTFFQLLYVSYMLRGLFNSLKNLHLQELFIFQFHFYSFSFRKKSVPNKLVGNPTPLKWPRRCPSQP